MNNADALQAMVNFTVADHNYVTLLTATFIKDSRFTYPLNYEQAMRRLKQAKAERDSLEVEMYAILENVVDRRPE